MSRICRISAYSAAFVGFSLALTAAGNFKAEANAGRGHQNLSGPFACAALQSGTPAYRDCMVLHSSSKMKTVNKDTQLKGEPVSSSQAVGILNKGTKVALIERTANGFWCYVQSGNQYGYLPFEDLN